MGLLPYSPPFLYGLVSCIKTIFYHIWRAFSLTKSLFFYSTKNLRTAATRSFQIASIFSPSSFGLHSLTSLSPNEYTGEFLPEISRLFNNYSVRLEIANRIMKRHSGMEFGCDIEKDRIRTWVTERMVIAQPPSRSEL
ncbi:MAG: hypothetical protein BROFUL_01573 [Candidatus Brocadia fulgida]|uniref:Uncharacterized protein n=1 Tax=Candidatus Brocadia fulgida TaxID=380242 RepID=A0A0M2UV73_9BACT|nr:MAG: hypothetical protein BROFUL_01573 [Candidatus Brocadia fulgida]